QGTPDQSAAQASVSQRTAEVQGTANSQRTASVQGTASFHSTAVPHDSDAVQEQNVQEEDTAHPFFDDIVDKDVAVTPDLE
ncbi:hypothetical protein Tco_0544418, partial [Tanacetum coccineum]